MLRHRLNGLGKPLSRTRISRAGALLAVGVLALALGGCSMFHRARPGSEVGSEVKNPPGSNEPYPHLGSVPDRPKSTETADTRREIARGLVADREAAHYTDQALRGGTEASAPPPPAPVPALADSALSGAATGAVGAKTQSASTADDKPGFFGRLFHHGKEQPAEPAGPAPLPAQPTKPVDVEPVPSP